jgi:hypothetical protein
MKTCASVSTKKKPARRFKNGVLQEIFDLYYCLYYKNKVSKDTSR